MDVHFRVLHGGLKVSGLLAFRNGVQSSITNFCANVKFQVKGARVQTSRGSELERSTSEKSSRE